MGGQITSDLSWCVVKANIFLRNCWIQGVRLCIIAAMEELDGDTMGLSADGRYAERDVVQFVAMKDFLNPNVPLEHRQAILAKQVLAEIPNQLVSYMAKNSLKPRTTPDQPLPL